MKEQIETRLKELISEREKIIAYSHQLTGAIAFAQELLKKIDEGKADIEGDK